jgi:serine protease Do
VEGSPAAQAGVMPGDVIVGLNGDAVREVRDLVRMVGASDPQDEVDIEVWRLGTTQTLRARLGDAVGGEVAVTREMPETEGSRLGMRVEELDDAMRRSLRVASNVAGVVIRDVERESAAAGKGLRPGDIVVGVGQSPIISVEEFAIAIGEAIGSGRNVVVLQVMRGEVLQFVALPLR